jgi:peptidoglycan/xylan/chitin deacetylase (PgdA/CDA1 family)
MRRPFAALSLGIALSFSADAQLVPILAYHEVDPEPQRGWCVRSEDFDEQLAFLAATQRSVIPIETLVDYIRGRRDSLPADSVVITVDDGWLCAYTQMNAALKQHDYPYSLYVYPKIVGTGSHALNWEQIRDLAAHGADVESHTVTHPHLMRRSHPEMTDEQYSEWLRNELVASKETIEKEVGHPVNVLAYPYGDHDAAVEREVARAGYAAALTSEIGLNSRATNPMKLRRIPIESDTTLDQFRQRLGDAPLQLADCSINDGSIVSSSSITLRVGDHFSTLHAGVLGRPMRTYEGDTISIPVDGLKPGRHRIVVWADDDNGRRHSAILTFYTSAAELARYEAMEKELSELPLHHATAAGESN